MISAGNEEDKAEFMAATSYSPTAGFRSLKLTDEKGNLQAMVGYDFWTPNAVQMHIWIKDPEAYLSREFIKEGFTYPFNSGRNLVIGVTPADNVRALDFNRRIGFRETHRVRDGWSLGTDMVIQEMSRDECRWIPRSRHELAQ